MTRIDLTRRDALKLGGAAFVASAVATPAAAKAKPNAVFDLDFSDPDDVAANSSANPGWVLDRYNPSLGYDPVAFTRAMFDGDDRLCIDIDGDGPTSGFYAYHGQKYQDADGAYWQTGTGSRLSYRFYIDPAWESDDDGQQTGVWPVLGNANGSISAYPILEYQDSDASDTGEGGFRVYVYVADEDGNFEEARWEYLGLPKKLKIDPEEGGWVDVEAQLQRTSEGAALKWRINNKLVADERGYNVFAPSTQFLEFIFNSANFGVDQTYYYDDIALTEPGRASGK
jgi:hypothetical protein